MKYCHMPSSHHRKKHKHFQPPPHSHTAKPKNKGGAASVLAVAGAVLGLGIMYFASTGNIVSMVIGLAAGTLLGYVIGKGIDKSGMKK
jgi:hypothetical protein